MVEGTDDGKIKTTQVKTIQVWFFCELEWVQCGLDKDTI